MGGMYRTRPLDPPMIPVAVWVQIALNRIVHTVNQFICIFLVMYGILVSKDIEY